MSLPATAQGATPGEVDPTFGENGRSVVAGEDSNAIGLILPDGSLLVASQSRNTPVDAGTIVELRHVDSEGQADPGFGIDGVARHEFADRTDLMQSVARAPDGRVYLGGWTRQERSQQTWDDLAVFAVDSQGAVVTAFGGGGLLSYDLSATDSAGTYDSAAALAVTPDGQLLAAGYSASNNNHTYDEWSYDRSPHLLRFNADGVIERKFDLHQFFADTSLCAGVTGLLLRTDGSLLVGDDAGISAFVGDSALQSFGVDGGAADKYWYPWAGCPGLRSFSATPSGDLLTVSVVNLQDEQRGFVLNRLHEDGTRIDGAVQALPVPLGRLVGNDARFADLAIDQIVTSRPMQSAVDDRVYVLFEFRWSVKYPGTDVGDGWAIVRFVRDGTLDTGWGTNGVVVLEKGDPGTWATVPTLLEPLADGKIVAMSANGVLTRLFGGQRDGHGAINIDVGHDVSEDTGQVSILVTRTGGSAGAVSVQYSTTADLYGPATDGEDFTAVSGRLDWAVGDSSPREIVIPILQDTLEESSEYFNVNIESPSGGAVLLNTKAVLAINDDGDTSTPPPPPPPPPPTVTPLPNESSSGGGAIDVATLSILSSLIALSVVRRRRRHPSSYQTSGVACLCLLLASTVRAENPSQKVIRVNNVKELYSAVNYSANRGATVRLAPGIYLLSTMNERGVLRRNRGALRLPPGMSLVGAEKRVDTNGDGVPDPVSATRPDEFAVPGTATIIDGSALDLPFEPRADCAGEIFFAPNPVIHVGVNNLISHLTVLAGNHVAISEPTNDPVDPNGNLSMEVTYSVLESALGLSMGFSNTECAARRARSVLSFSHNVVHGSGMLISNFLTGDASNDHSDGPAIWATVTSNLFYNTGKALRAAGGDKGTDGGSVTLYMSGNVFRNNAENLQLLGAVSRFLTPAVGNRLSVRSEFDTFGTAFSNLTLTAGAGALDDPQRNELHAEFIRSHFVRESPDTPPEVSITGGGGSYNHVKVFIRRATVRTSAGARVQGGLLIQDETEGGTAPNTARLEGSQRDFIRFNQGLPAPPANFFLEH
jgi:hypothetical protein